MSLVDIGDIRLNWRQWGHGDITVVFIHGNLACADWFELTAARLPDRFRVVGIDWRGCGDSDKPAPTTDFANYAIEQHAADMLAVLDALAIEHCHLATHSTGGLIAFHMLLAQPQRFGKILALAPACPSGIPFAPESHVFFEIMKASRKNTRKALALAACTLFRIEHLVPGAEPKYAEHVTASQRDLFERLVDKTCGVSDGVWFGTPFHLNRAWENGAMRERQAGIPHPHLVLWGALDAFIPRAEMEEMTRCMPDCRLEIIADVGHSLNIEQPDLYTRYFVDFLSA
ncbi:MAG: alpha/beta hydrolase [Rhodospirillales bacterium]|nr:alpha/beta hydrolase [Rhodospirillales bacterium]